MGSEMCIRDSYILATAKWLWILSKFSNFVGGYGKYRAVAYPFICLVMLSCYQILSMAASFYISFVHGCIAIIMNTRKMPNIKNIFRVFGFGEEEEEAPSPPSKDEKSDGDNSLGGLLNAAAAQRDAGGADPRAAIAGDVFKKMGNAAGSLWDGIVKIIKGFLAVLTCLAVFLINIGIIMIMCTMLFLFNVLRCFFINIFEMFIPDKGAWTKFKKEHGNNKLFIISLIFILSLIHI